MTGPIPWPFPIPHPGPLPGPRPVPVPQPGPGGAPGFTDPVIGQTGSVGFDSSTVIGQVGVNLPAAPSSSSSTPLGPQPVGDWKQFLIWIAALAALWLILTAAQDAGYPEFANGMAGLILFGSILAMGPKAVTNAKLIFT